ncbi:protein of unknown function [Xenorhabdus bovienii]|uniref:Uncharacterized protein n=2 Tax=Xenorhabdus bovienii TaxID=40576 RepID=A0A0B6X952_XENBV|nr:hypothetical protein XBKB1_1510017 [Xenorhabdus bovienii str. kraussei Becker Underwood]CDM90110.1 protein of unknown function [Xenorhabdus bovienii]
MVGRYWFLNDPILPICDDKVTRLVLYGVIREDMMHIRYTIPIVYSIVSLCSDNSDSF